MSQRKQAAPSGTLRFEAGLPLYGHELDDDITPLEAGLGMFAKVKDKEDFIGRDALVAQKEAGLTRKSVGIELQDTSGKVPLSSKNLKHSSLRCTK